MLHISGSITARLRCGGNINDFSQYCVVALQDACLKILSNRVSNSLIADVSPCSASVEKLRKSRRLRIQQYETQQGGDNLHYLKILGSSILIYTKTGQKLGVNTSHITNHLLTYIHSLSVDIVNSSDCISISSCILSK